VSSGRSAALRLGDRVGRYRVVELIGRGGMGCVYRAVDERLEREVALKLLALDDDDPQARRDAARRMMREGRAAAAFAHANAVAVYEVGEHEGAPYIVMELAHGRPLRAFVGDAAVPLVERLRWLGGVARALAAAHRAGLVHRDVKPDNVIVGDDGMVKLLDFGVARRLPRSDDGSLLHSHDGTTITVDGELVGTPAYMPPEQLRGERVDGRADQFSWAVMAYELIAGKKPWTAPSAPALIAAIIGREAEWLTATGLPRAVAATVMRALSKAADDRFATMDELLAALAGSAVTRARPPRRWLRAARGPLAFGALFAVAAGGAFWLARARAPAAAVVPVAVAPATTTTTTATVRVRFPCPPAPRRDDVTLPCAEGLRGWCDGDGRPLACCPAGLVATGSDGICACPPGGSTERLECPSAQHAVDEYRRLYLPSAVRSAYADCAPRAPERLDLALDVWVDPNGRMFDARIAEAYTADARLQRCVVDRLRRLELDPPPNGFARLTLGGRE
jgi:serine/threonine-protein kinase